MKPEAFVCMLTTQLAIQPAAMFLAAAESAIDRRRAAEAARATCTQPPTLRPGDVVPGDHDLFEVCPAQNSQPSHPFLVDQRRG